MATESIHFEDFYRNVDHNGGTNYATSNAVTKNYTSLSEACYITNISMTYTATFDASQWSAGWSWSLEGSYDGGSTWVSLGFSDSQGGIAGTYNGSVSTNYTGLSGILGKSLQLRLNCSFQRTTSSWLASDKRMYLSNIYLTITYTPKAYITFTGDGVTTTTSAVETNQAPSVPTLTTINAAIGTGYEFGYWQSGSNTYAHNAIPKCNGTDVTYTSVRQKITYTVNTNAVNQGGASITAPSGQTGAQTYQIDGNNIIVTTPTADYSYVANGSVIYVFDYWSVADSSGNDVGSNVTTHTYTYGQLTASNIPTLFASGRTITITAHYKRVYDIALSVADSASLDPSSAGRNGISTVTVTCGASTYTYTKAQICAGVTCRVDSVTVQIDVALTNKDEYLVWSTNHTDVGTSQSAAYQSNWVNDIYRCTWILVSSTSSWSICLLKQYFDLTISGDTDGVVKVYSVNSQNVKTEIAASHIPRTTQLVIEADRQLEIQTTHDADVTSISPNVSGVTSVSNGVGAITSLLQNYTIVISRTPATVTVTQTVYLDGVASPDIVTSITRSTSQQFTVAQADGWSVASATLTMGETQIEVWSNVTAISYTVDHVVDSCVFTVYRVQTPEAYISVTALNSLYGAITFNGSVSVLKSNFNGFTVGAITANSEYEVVGAAYKWMVGQSEVASGVIPLGSQYTITYPGAIPSDSMVQCVVWATYRKNIIYYSSRQNNTTTVKRPSALYYTPVGGTPQPVIAVYAQTSTHTTPILLFGDVQ